MINKIKNNLLGIIIGGIIFGSIGITIAYQINASQIAYNKSGTNVNVSSVITELYGMADSYINYTKGANGGEEILLDPTGATENCTTSTSDYEQKNGCMKFYIYAEDKNSYYAILDHNTTAKVNDCGTDNNCWKKAQIQVITDTSSWLSTYQARNITADEVWNITKLTNNKPNWHSSKNKQTFFFEDNPKSNENLSLYPFLYNYTNCNGWGCTITDNTIDSYWTQSRQIGTSDGKWLVGMAGDLFARTQTFDSCGVRPVITISK